MKALGKYREEALATNNGYQKVTERFRRGSSGRCLKRRHSAHLIEESVQSIQKLASEITQTVSNCRRTLFAGNRR